MPCSISLTDLISSARLQTSALWKICICLCSANRDESILQRCGDRLYLKSRVAWIAPPPFYLVVTTQQMTTQPLVRVKDSFVPDSAAPQLSLIARRHLKSRCYVLPLMPETTETWSVNDEFVYVKKANINTAFSSWHIDEKWLNRWIILIQKIYTYEVYDISLWGRDRHTYIYRRERQIYRLADSTEGYY